MVGHASLGQTTSGREQSTLNGMVSPPCAIVNDPPVALADAGSTDAGVPVTVSVLLNDTDIDGDTLSVVSTTAPANGAIVVNAAALHDAGAIDAQEIGYSLAAGAAYLRIFTTAGFDIDAACRLISFRYAVTDEQFTQIAKLRAARLAWARICELSGAAPTARAQHQHAVTSAAMLTRYDAHTNMLRGTVATFAAAVGGADAITTLPFDTALGEPDGFARRMARNVSALLTGESGLDQVTDPAGGAGAVEMLTSRLAQSAWSEFTAIERSGGIDAAVADGSLATAVARARADRDRRIATRRRPITGVSEFPNAAESAADLPPRPASSATGALHRWSEPFEAMRDDPPPQPMLLVRIGTEAAASPRVTFIRNLLAAGGVAVTEVGYDGLGEARAAAAMLAGADRDYADLLEAHGITRRRAPPTCARAAGRRRANRRRRG